MSRYTFPSLRSPNYEIKGAFAYEQNILRVIGGWPEVDNPHRGKYDASLVPEPNNPHSKAGNAVSVRVYGRVVGYLASEDSKDYAPHIHRIVASGHEIEVPARVYVYRKFDGGLDSYINIALPDVDQMVPLNAHALRGVAVLPWGKVAQIKGEDDHFDHLFNYIPPSGKGLAIVTLHRAVKQLKSGEEREYVEVRVDGERGGQMTPATSAQFMPAIRHAMDMEKTLGAWTRVEGSGLAVNLTAQAARSNELTDDWLREMPEFPVLVPEAEAYDVPPAYKPEATRERKSRNQREAIREVKVNAPVPANDVKRGQQRMNDKSSSSKATKGCCSLLVALIALFILIGIFAG